MELARRTHRSVKRTLGITFVLLAAVILIAGVYLSQSGQASFWGVIGVAAVFLAVPFAMAATISKTERDAERFLAADESTQFVVGPSSLVVGDTVVPYERITCMYANAESEQYSSGGIRGEAMAYRMGLSENQPTAGRAVGAAIGTGQRRKMYREGAKSAISLTIGIDQKSTIAAPAGMVNQLKTLPKRGDDPGRIDIPFGAYLSTDDLEVLLGAVHRATGGTAFPIAIVAGVMNWSAAQAATCETREKIWEELPSLVPGA